MATLEIEAIRKTPQIRRKPLLPHRLEDRMELPAVMRIPATLNEYLDLLDACDYKIEFSNGAIVSILETDPLNTNITMGTATLTHEQIVMNLGFVLNQLFFRQPDFIVIGSNMPTFVGEGLSAYNPDVSVVRGTPDVRPYKSKKRSINTLFNPWLVVEVLSQGTRDYDLGEKFLNYRRIPSLEHILFIEQYWTEVTIYTRQTNGTWSSSLLENPSSSFSLANGTLNLEDIYMKIIHEK
jgi:Uma2 family endonuclease